MRKVYVCDDSLEGIFTGIYYAWGSRHLGQWERDALTVRSNETMELFSEYVQLPAEADKASVVQRTVQKRLGPEGYEHIYAAAMSEDPAKADAILGTVIAAAKVSNSRMVMKHLSDLSVSKVFELSRMVLNESHHYKMFVRFRELRNGVLFAEITPKCNILPLLISHFSDRFPLENWAIYDHNRKEFLLHQKQKGCAILAGEELNMEEIEKFSDEEEYMEDLFRQFVESISIKERENWKLQRQNLPLRFRNHMTEF